MRIPQNFPALASLALAQSRQSFGCGENPRMCFRWWKTHAGMKNRTPWVLLAKKYTFRLRNALGCYFGGGKKCGNGDTHSLGFIRKNHTFLLWNTLGCFAGGKNLCRNGGTDSRILVRPGLEPGLCVLCRPRASPLGNLTTVGHLAKASPAPSLDFHRFLLSFSTTENGVFRRMTELSAR